MAIDMSELRDELTLLEAKVVARLRNRGTGPSDVPASEAAAEPATGAAPTDDAKPSKSVLETLRTARLPMLLTAPLTFALIVPVVFLDLSVSFYQLICFPVWEIEPAERSDHVILDRHRLAYLNAFEKLGCVYCGYFNGVIGFTRDVASRTEAYWCPIKHARRPSAPHERYDTFLDYGDAVAWRNRLDELKRIIG